MGSMSIFPHDVCVCMLNSNWLATQMARTTESVFWARSHLQEHDQTCSKLYSHVDIAACAGGELGKVPAAKLTKRAFNRERQETKRRTA